MCNFSRHYPIPATDHVDLIRREAAKLLWADKGIRAWYDKTASSLLGFSASVTADKCDGLGRRNWVIFEYVEFSFISVGADFYF